MSSPLQAEFLSVEDYLSGEETSETRHEYIGGLAYAMAGSSDAHNLIAGNFYGELRNHLRGGPCRVFISDIKTRLFLASRYIFYYPDVMVTCDPRDTNPYFKQFPKVIVEVLSESTEGTDRREKLWNYTQIQTLQEYVLAAQDRMEVTVFRRANQWRPEILHPPHHEIQLESLDCQLHLREIYEGVKV